MSDRYSASRTDIQVVFGGVDITVLLNKDYTSFTYTDNEEDEADDFQLKVIDRDGKWLRKWLGAFTESAALGGDIISAPPENDTSSNSSGGSSGASSSKSSARAYKVTASSGVNVRSYPSDKGKLLGQLPYGTVVDVIKFSDGWANISYSGKSAYIKGKNLKDVSSGGGSSSSSSSSASSGSSGSGWKIGDSVSVTGNPQYSSYGIGTPGYYVTNHKGKITHLNLKTGIPYPICVDYLGWFAENQVTKLSADEGQNTNSGEKGSKGLKISAVICRQNRNNDGKDVLLDCGTFELDSIDAQGPPATVTIKGTSLAYSSTIRQTLKSRSWESTTLKGITKTIAEKNGMGFLFESAKDPKYTRVEQYRASDISFLQRLCHDAGCSLKITNNIVVIFDQEKYEQKNAVRTICFGEKGGYTKYKLSTAESDNYTSCRVYCTTPSGAVISATEYSENYDGDDFKGQCLEVRQKVSSVGEAQNLAHKLLRLHNKYEYTASFTFPGDPSLVAGVAVELEDFGAWDGKYIVKQAVHTVSSGGYTTQITLRKALKASESVAENTAAEETDEQIQELAMQVIRGVWGNGEDRANKLTAAGHDYDKIQARVNKILYG